MYEKYTTRTISKTTTTTTTTTTTIATKTTTKTTTITTTTVVANFVGGKMKELEVVHLSSLNLPFWHDQKMEPPDVRCNFFRVKKENTILIKL
jgi:hypothetical protein